MAQLARIAASLALTVSVSAAPAAWAQQPVRTDQWPAAAAALGIEASQGLSARQARAVRGGGLSIETTGVAVQTAGVGYWAGAAVSLAGSAGGRTVTIAIDPNGLRFHTDGTAVVGDHSQFQGILATQTGVYNGYVAFRGDTSTLSVIAVPGMFAVDFR